MTEQFTLATFYDRADVIGVAPTYGQATGRPDWGSKMQELIPEYMRVGLARYILFGLMPGDFLTAVLESNLMRAYGRADSTNARCIGDYVSFLYNFAPSDCYGSVKAVQEWSDAGGLMGKPAETT